MTASGAATATSSAALAAGRHLDDRVHAVGRQLLDRRGGVDGAVVDDVVGAGGGGQRSLRRAAHRRDDRRPGPAGQLDGGVPDRSGPAGDEHGAAGQAARRQPRRIGVALGQGAVGGEGRDAEAGTDVERRRVRQRDGLAGRQHEGLLGCAVAAPPRGLPHPHPLADARRIDSVADGVDDAGTVLVRHPLGERPRRSRPAEAGLPVGGVDAGHVDPNPHLARSGIGLRPVDQRQDLWSSGHGVDDRSHDVIFAV